MVFEVGAYDLTVHGVVARLMSQHGWFIRIAVTKNCVSNNLQAVRKLLTLEMQGEKKRIPLRHPNPA